MASEDEELEFVDYDEEEVQDEPVEDEELEFVDYDNPEGAAEAPMEDEEPINPRDYTDIGLLEATAQAPVNVASGVGSLVGAIPDVANAYARAQATPGGVMGAVGNALIENPVGALVTGGRMASSMAGGALGAMAGAFTGGAGGAVVGGPAGAAAGAGIGGYTGANVGAAAGSVGFERILNGVEDIFKVDLGALDYKDKSWGGALNQVYGESVENLTGALAGKALGSITKGFGQATGYLGRGAANKKVQIQARRDPKEALRLTLASQQFAGTRDAIDSVSDDAAQAIIDRGYVLRHQKNPEIPQIVKEGDVFKTTKKIIEYKDPLTKRNLIGDAGIEVQEALTKVDKTYRVKDVDLFFDEAKSETMKGVLKSDIAPVKDEVLRVFKIKAAEKAGYSLDGVDDYLVAKPAELRKVEADIKKLTSKDQKLEFAKSVKGLSRLQKAEQHSVANQLDNLKLQRSSLEDDLSSFQTKIEDAQLSSYEMWEASRDASDKIWSSRPGQDPNFQKLEGDLKVNSLLGEFRDRVQKDFKEVLGKSPEDLIAYEKANGKYSGLMTVKKVSEGLIDFESGALRRPGNPIEGALKKVSKYLPFTNKADATHPAIADFQAVDKAMSGISYKEGVAERFYRYMSAGGLPPVEKSLTSLGDWFTPSRGAYFTRSLLAIDEYGRLYPQELESNKEQIGQSQARMSQGLEKANDILQRGVGQSEAIQRQLLKEGIKDPNAKPFLPATKGNSGLLEGVDISLDNRPLSPDDLLQYFDNLASSSLNAFERAERRKYYNTHKKFMPEASEASEEDRVSDEEIDKKIQIEKAREDIQRFKSSKDVVKFSRMSYQPQKESYQTLAYEEDAMGDETFEKSYGLVRGVEGGFKEASHNDYRTNLGVTQPTYNAYLKRLGRPSGDVADITEEETREIYQSYWEDSGAGSLPWPLSHLVFDAAINSGPAQAKKHLQKILGVKRDGVFGDTTFGALEGSNLMTVADEYLKERESFYHDLIKRKPEKAEYRNGWANRIKELRKVVKRGQGTLV